MATLETTETEEQLAVVRKQIDIASLFLSTLFDSEDVVIYRPIESWTENGKKCSSVGYRQTSYYKCSNGLGRILPMMWHASVQQTHNLYFGVCPRFGKYGKYDLEWQIRMVRVLWSDIDHILPVEALKRVADARLPEPSIAVNSGNGVHLYWLLDEPFIVSEEEPLSVETEWVELPNKKRKPRKYVQQGEERLYLDKHKYLKQLCPRAEFIKDILTGIAKPIGGDHTTDLSRLLRIPGSMNRKDQRNGRAPVQTELLKCDSTLRYPLSVFESFKCESPSSERARKVRTMPLPSKRKPTATKLDKLADLIAACGIAEVGQRSEADFTLCCYAVQNGIDRDIVWRQVETVGKFADEGERYFDITWGNAESQTRERKLEKMEAKSTKQARPQNDDDTSPSRRNVITVDESTTYVGDTLHQVTDCLVASGQCFARAGQIVAIFDSQIHSILQSTELTGLLSQYIEFYFVKGSEDRVEGDYKPFPSTYASTWLNNHCELARLPVIKSYVNNPVYSDDWRLIGPGYDAQSGIYYSGEAILPRVDTTHIDALLHDFCFKTRGDRTNYLGMLLTMVLIPRFIGSKPAILLCANQAELGKTILAQIVSILRDGKPAETVSYNPNDEEFEKRLGAVVRRGATTIIIDNAKRSARNPIIESACLERSLTDPILSFRLLGQSDTIRAENSHFFCITANSPEVSRDLVTRSLIVNLHYEGDPTKRTFTIENPEGYALEHRKEILGELLGMVERWKAAGSPRAKTNTRFNKQGWGNIIGGILACAGEPDFMINADEASAQLDETKRDFTELVAVLADHDQGTWTPAELVEQCATHRLLAAGLGEGSAKSKSTRMGIIASRFVNETFLLEDGRIFVFLRQLARKGCEFRVTTP